MGKAVAEIEVAGPISAAEDLWYDTARWPSFVDGFHHVVKREGDWPREPGARVVWDSVPRRARPGVASASSASRCASSQTVDVEDPRINGLADGLLRPPARRAGAGSTLELDYR